MDINCISPYIRVAMDNVIKSPWILKERVIFDYELLYVKEGKVQITVEDQVYLGQPGDIFLFKPKQRHSITILGKESFRQPHLHFDLFYQTDSPDVKVSFKPAEQMSEAEMNLFREDITSSGPFELPNKIYLKNIKYFEQYLFEIIEEFEAKKPYYEFIVKGLFIRLWTYIIRESYWNSNPQVMSNLKELNKIKDYIAYSIHRDITLDELSREFKISKYYLNRLFKTAFGVAPIHYHQSIRMEKIKEAIQFTGVGLTEIAERYGFSSINAFSRAFKNIEGVSPSFYRNKNSK